MDKRIDIVIPIYNAYDDLVACIDSINRHTDTSFVNLVLINDNSSDKRIYKYLCDIDNDNVTVVNNRENKGFSYNVNVGMSQSKNDVVLLNSDTIVTAGWLDKLCACAYKKCEIGTVTPLSNNATLCSVPNMFEENILDGLTIDQAAEIVERTSLHRYPVITVANGFCMYIKREVIDSIGMFDSETFGRGYGEENDFCFRAEQMGYINVMCDDTYIYHSGTKSFMTSEKMTLLQKHEEILRSRYGKQMQRNDIYVRDNPNSDVGTNAKIHFALANGKTNILYLLHSDFDEKAEDHIGGTQFHVMQLCEGLRDKYNVFVAAIDGEFLNLTIYSGVNKFAFKYYIVKKPFFAYHNSDIRRIFENVLIGFKIDVVHVHHVIKISLDIFEVCSQLNIPVYFTLHDFYSICPSEKLLDAKGKICCSYSEVNGGCSNCLKKNSGYNNGISVIKRWREEFADAIGRCAGIFVPNESVAEIVSKVYPDIEDKINVIAHGLDYVRVAYNPECQNRHVIDCRIEFEIEDTDRKDMGLFIHGWANISEREINSPTIYIKASVNGDEVLIPTFQYVRRDVSEKYECGFKALIPNTILKDKDCELRLMLDDGENLLNATQLIELKGKASTSRNTVGRINVAFIGGINDAKGGKQIAEIVKRCKSDINFYIFGGIGSEDLVDINRANLVKCGWYRQGNLKQLIDIYKIDVIGILSVWPETFSYTLSESIHCGIPVIVTDIGALGMRVKSEGCGWLVSVDACVEETLNILNTLETNRCEIETVKDRISKIVLDSERTMIDKYISVYQSSGKNKIEVGEVVSADFDFLFEGYKDKRGIDDSISLPNAEYIRVINENNRIKNSVSYRVSQKMVTSKIPGKYFIYSLLKKFLK